MIRQSVVQDSQQKVKLHIVCNDCNEMKIKAQLLTTLGFTFCKKSDITIIISINENI